MMLIDQMNRQCLRLYREESGVVLGFGVVVYLTLVVVTMSVYAVGENVRQRIELQNAADAAAYSAAVVQADALSRVAAINRAMSWTYVQMTRRHMDYILHKWLRLVSDVYARDRAEQLAKWSALHDGISHCDGYRRRVFWIGSEGRNGYLRINQSQWYRHSTIRQVAYGFPLDSVRQQIDDDRRAIDAMNRFESNILANLPGQVMGTVRSVLQGNLRGTFGDASPANGGANFRFQVLQSNSPERDYTELYDDEDMFLRASNSSTSDFDLGHDTWYPGPRGQGSWNRTREYIQWGRGGGGPWLVADWRSNVEGYPGFPVYSKGCGLHYVSSTWYRDPVWRRNRYWGRGNGIRGNDFRIYDGYYRSHEVRPRRLTSEYFRRGGSLVVGVARKINNPLAFMAADSSRLGLYRFFSPNVRDRFGWAASAAQAGYRDGVAGGYNPKRDSQTRGDFVDSVGNLIETDWNAVLVALQRAWVGSRENSSSGSAILDELHGSWSDWGNLFVGGSGVRGQLREIGGLRESDILH